jgi:hypothetical protein
MMVLGQCAMVPNAGECLRWPWKGVRRSRDRRQGPEKPKPNGRLKSLLMTEGPRATCGQDNGAASDKA